MLIQKGQIPEIDQYGFSLENIGDISEPFQAMTGWLVVKLVEKYGERILPIEEARHDINHNLKRVKNDERLDELLTKWRDEVEIEIFEKTLEKAQVVTIPTRSRGGGN